MLSASVRVSCQPKAKSLASTYRRPIATQKQSGICPGCSYCGGKSIQLSSAPITRTPTTELVTRSRTLTASKHQPSARPAKLLFTRISSELDALRGPVTLRPLLFTNVSPALWDDFTRRYASHPCLSLGSKWEYSAAHATITVVALATPFHDIAPIIMSIQNTRLLLSGVDSQDRFERLHVNRSRFSKLTASGSRSDREPDCALLALDYHLAIPTIVWEVGHSQGLPALIRRAKMWCRRYDGRVRVVVLVKYLRPNPRVDRAALLWVYRPLWRPEDERWTAAQDGPTYTLFPVPQNAGAVSDAIPLTYEDYFGPGNAGPGVDVQRRCDLPLQLVRREIEAGIQKTIVQDRYRHVSGGSSVAGNVGGQGGEAEDEGEEREEREDSPEGEPYQEYGDDWDAGMSDISDA